MKNILSFLLSLSLCAAVVSGANYAIADEPADYVITAADAHGVVLVAQADAGSGSQDGAAGAPTAKAGEAPTGSSTTPAAPTASPADELHDPIKEPGAAWSDIKAAKKVGWSVLVFAALVMLCKLAGRAKSIGMLAWLGKGKAAVVVGGLGALAAACYNAAAAGGAWTAMMIAGLVAIGHYLDAGSKGT